MENTVEQLRAKISDLEGELMYLKKENEENLLKYNKVHQLVSEIYDATQIASEGNKEIENLKEYIQNFSKDNFIYF